MFWLVLWFLPRASKTQCKGPSKAQSDHSPGARGPGEPLCPPGNNSLLTCMEDGLWSFPEALCELMCLAPPPVPNADLQTARCRENKHKVGSFCKYKCKPGYHVPGSSRKSKK